MPASKKSPDELKWIEDPEAKLVRPPEEFELLEDRTFSNTVLKKSRENIFVPLGLLATAACLTMGLANMKKGDSKKQQFYMRGRVGFQAFTLAAMTIGVYLTDRNRRVNQSKQSTSR